MEIKFRTDSAEENLLVQGEAKWRSLSSTRVREGVGVLVSYSDFGDESKRENFTNDEKKVVEKYTNGKTREEGYYKNGRKDGLWIYYRLDGNENFRLLPEGKRINTEFP